MSESVYVRNEKPTSVYEKAVLSKTDYENWCHEENKKYFEEYVPISKLESKTKELEAEKAKSRDYEEVIRESIDDLFCYTDQKNVACYLQKVLEKHKTKLSPEGDNE